MSERGHMTERARETIEADLAGLARRRRRRFAVGALGTLALAVGVGLRDGRLPPPHMLVPGALLAGLAVLCQALLLGVVWPSRPVVRGLVAAAGAAGLLAVLSAAGLPPPVGAGDVCFYEGTGLSAALMLGLALLGRGGAARRHGPITALLGLSGGLAAVLSLQLACDDPTFGHLLYWHGGVLVASVALAVGLRRLG